MTETAVGRAFDMLTETPEVRTIRDQHRDFYLALARRATSAMRGPETMSWLAVLDAEHDNLRTALRWNLDSGDADEALALAIALSPYWSRRGHWTEGGDWLDRALTLGGPSHRLHATALVRCADLAAAADDLEGTRTFAERALTAARATGDAAEASRALTHLAWVGTAGRDKVSIGEEALDLARKSGDERATTHALVLLGRRTRDAGRWDEGLALLQEGLATARDLGEGPLLARALFEVGLAHAYGARVDLVKTGACFDECMRLCREQQLDFDVWVLDGMAWVARDTEGVRPARALWEEAAQTCRSQREKFNLPFFLICAGMMARAAGDTDTARDRLEEAVATCRQLGAAATGRTHGYLWWGLDQLRLLARDVGDDAAYGAHSEQLAQLSARQEMPMGRARQRAASGDLTGAKAALGEALDAAREFGDRNVINRAIVHLARIAMDEGDLSEARSRLEELAREQPDPQLLGAPTICLADLSLLEGDIAGAAELQRRVIAQWRDRGYRFGLSWALEAPARTAIARGERERAAMLFGAAEALTRALGIAGRSAHWVLEGDAALDRQADYDAAVSGLRAAMGNEAFEAAWSRGRALSEPEAIALALE